MKLNNPGMREEQKRIAMYCHEALSSAADAVLNASNGHRNRALNDEAFGLAGLIHYGEFTEADIHRDLTAAAAANGLKQSEISKTLKSAISKGKETPRIISESTHSGNPTTAAQTPSRALQEPRSEANKAKATKEMSEAIWSACKPANMNQEYIKRKLGLSDGLREDAGKNLVVPAYTLDGELAFVQTITKTGKLFPKGSMPSSTPEACFVVDGQLQDSETIYIVEGLGHGWSVHQATRKPAAVCLGVGRVAGVAKALREAYPKAQLIIVADVGQEPQMEAIARSIGGMWIELPSDLGEKGDINDLHQRDGLQAVADLLASPRQVSWRYKLQTPADLAALEPVRYRIKHVMPESGIGALYGPSTSGKSFVGIDLGGAIARDVEWHGYKTCACPVTYIASEGEAGIAQRIKAYQKSHGPLPDTFRVITTSLDILNGGDRLDLVQAIRAAGQEGGIVIFDTLNRAAPGIDENDSAAMGAVITALKWIQSQIGGMVLVVHHTGKDSSRGPRGHSSLFAALDFGIEVSRDGDRRTWINRKTRDGDDGKEHQFRLKVVEVGSDEDGDPLTSCVVEAEVDPGQAVRSIKLPIGGNQRIIWDALGELLRQPEALAAREAPEELPFGRPALRLEDVVPKLRGRLPEVEQKRQKERVTQAITGLVSRGALKLRDGWVWCA